MGKGMAVAIVVEAIVLAVAFVFSTTYFSLGLYQADALVTVALVVLWVLVAAVLLSVLWSRSMKREEMVRRFYIGKDYIYNPEIGYAPIRSIVRDNDAYELVTFAAESLARMSYGFEVAPAPDDFTPLYLVKSSLFVFHEPYSEDAQADEDSKPVVIDRWKGELMRVGDATSEDGYEVVGTFANARELARLMQDIEDRYERAHRIAYDATAANSGTVTSK